MSWKMEFRPGKCLESDCPKKLWMLYIEYHVRSPEKEIVHQVSSWHNLLAQSIHSTCHGQISSVRLTTSPFSVLYKWLIVASVVMMYWFVLFRFPSWTHGAFLGWIHQQGQSGFCHWQYGCQFPLSTRLQLSHTKCKSWVLVTNADQQMILY